MRRILPLVLALVGLLSVANVEPQLPSPKPGWTWSPNDIWKNVKVDESGKWPPLPPPPPPADTSAYTNLVGEGKGRVSASGEGFSGEGPEKAFDHSQDSKVCIKSTKLWLQYQFTGGVKQRVTAYTITSANDTPGRDPQHWRLLGYTPQHTWEVLDEQLNQEFPERFQKRLFKVAKPGDYDIYRLDVTANHGEECTQLADVELLTDKK